LAKKGKIFMRKINEITTIFKDEPLTNCLSGQKEAGDLIFGKSKNADDRTASGGKKLF